MLLSIKGQIKLRTKENHEKNKQKEERKEKKKRLYSVKSLLGDEVIGFNKLNATKVE
jgi:hypothetical protein